jgi:hypothetical protein
MITAREEEYLLNRAYIPEHTVGLMTRISGGEPYLIDNYFCCRTEDRVIIVGYPLERDFNAEELETLIHILTERFRPLYASIIAPDLPSSLAESCRERESDHYYTLDIHATRIKSRLQRLVDAALGELMVEHSTDINDAHRELMKEFVERVKPPVRIRELLFKMPEYVGHTSNSIVLNAWDRKKNLSAFYVVDLAARDFSTYVIGCHSKKHYVAGASDLLCFTMIKMSRECGKDYIHLGLGVNKGIRQFKKKWGGIPTMSYEMCELVLRKPSMLDTIKAMERIF